MSRRWTLRTSRTAKTGRRRPRERTPRTILGICWLRFTRAKETRTGVGNKYFAAELDEETRLRLIKEKLHPEDELQPFDDLTELECAFANRCQKLAKTLRLPRHDSAIHFDGVQFDDDADFQGYLFTDCSFENAVFSPDENVEFSVSVDAKFRDVTFSGSNSFKNATFSGWADFRRARFLSVENTPMPETNFSGATFRRGASFEGATFSGNVKFDGETTFGEVSSTLAMRSQLPATKLRSGVPSSVGKLISRVQHSIIKLLSNRHLCNGLFSTASFLGPMCFSTTQSS